MSEYKLQAVGITKDYPGTRALDNVSVNFEQGKVHALLGKNGAGKSTLVKILSGAIRPTSGQLILEGKSIRINRPIDAFKKGIATVYQELSLVPEMSVAENILLGRMPKKRIGPGKVIDWNRAYEQARQVLNRIEVDMDVTVKAGELGIAQQQIVEIAKAMSYEPSVLMLDEPTSSLAHHETQSLFSLIRRLAKKDVAIIYITHRLGELKEIADEITVLRNGQLIGTARMEDVSSEDIVHMMFGKIVPKQRPADLKVGQETVLKVRGLCRKDKFEDVSFDVKAGEILGIAGMLGAGRTELLKAIFGADRFDSGQIELGGVKFKRSDPVKMKRMGMGFTPEDRKSEALVQILSVRENMCLAGMEKIARSGFITAKREQKYVDRMVEKLRISLSSSESAVSSLSGGNQQKVVVGNWLNIEPDIILFDEPTRGIDVEAKQQIFEIMWELSRKGVSCVFVSTELEELVEVCHRILVMQRGRIVDEIDADKISADELFVKCMES